MRQKRCPDCGSSDVRPDDGRHDALTCSRHLLKQRDALRAENEQLRTLKDGLRQLSQLWADGHFDFADLAQLFEQVASLEAAEVKS